MNPLILALALLAYQNSLVPNHLFPYPEVMASAEEQLAISRHMFSDSPDFSRFTWSFAQAGPCPNLLALPGDGNDVPCSVMPFVPSTPQPVPVSLWTSYQQLVYTPPSSPSNQKASLAMSYIHTLYSAGLVWQLTVNAEGIKHDIWFCEYKKVSKRIMIAPLVYLDVDFLKPDRYQHVTAKPSGNYNIQTHEIKDWQLPLADFTKSLIYDVFEDVSKCGTPAYIYRTQPGELIMDIFSGLFSDAAEIMPGDRQIVVTPMLGTRKCGEYNYSAFLEFMTHRTSDTPGLRPDGPPLEVWTFQHPRNPETSLQAAIDPDQETSHARLSRLRADLAEDGLSGPIVVDPNMQQSMEGQRVLEDNRYKSGADMGNAALGLIEMLLANSQNDHLFELWFNYIGRHIDHIESINDTEINFNPFGPHCVENGEHVPAYPGHIPLLGQHFFPELEDCSFCEYHDLIVRKPRRAWSHRRLLDMNWTWGTSHGQRGNLREKAHAFIQALIWYDLDFPARASINDQHSKLAARQLSNTHQGQLEGVSLDTLEAEPSEATLNSTLSKKAEDIPDIFVLPFEPCFDPTWTFEYMLLYGEILDISQAPCGLLWGVL